MQIVGAQGLKRLFAAVLCVAVPTAIFAGDNGYTVKYDGGSVAGIKAWTDFGSDERR